jgi:DNA-binding CsgD family transcriptional regulator
LQDSIGQTTDALLRTHNDLQQLRQDSQSLLASKEQEIGRLRMHLNDQLKRLRAMNPVRPTNPELVELLHKKASDVKGIPFKSNGQRWREMMKMVSESAPQMYSFIAREGVLSHQELQTCILIWLNFSNSEIAVLLDTSQQRISNIRSIANKKLFGNASASPLRENLLNFPDMTADV